MGKGKIAALGIALAGTVLLVAAPGARAEMDVAKEVSTAATHAGLAAGAKEMPMVQMHLHHVVNCLVGPKGKGFDAKPGNPCKDQGNGAIPDTKASAQKKKLQQALAKANAGLKTKDMAAAQKDATDAQNILKAM
ncbi:MAG TPA: hypothetical protein VFA22_12395 [Stellaceae bacterium]|nr:hypothetical protein [Stellaceae bacterium]